MTLLCYVTPEEVLGNDHVLSEGAQRDITRLGYLLGVFGEDHVLSVKRSGCFPRVSREDHVRAEGS